MSGEERAKAIDDLTMAIRVRQAEREVVNARNDAEREAQQAMKDTARIREKEIEQIGLLSNVDAQRLKGFLELARAGKISADDIGASEELRKAISRSDTLRGLVEPQIRERAGEILGQEVPLGTAPPQGPGLPVDVAGFGDLAQAPTQQTRRVLVEFTDEIEVVNEINVGVDESVAQLVGDAAIAGQNELLANVLEIIRPAITTAIQNEISTQNEGVFPA